jgi:inorganic pyrophosphatase
MCEYAISLIPKPAARAAALSLPGTGADELILLCGTVEQTVGPDAHEIPALVLAENQAEDRATVWAQPIALLHLAIDGTSVQEVVCVEEGSSPAAFTALTVVPEGRSRLREAIARAYPGRPCALLAIEDVCRAERLLGSAWLDYLRITLHRD